MIKTKYIRESKGNIAIIVAVSLMVLIGILAIVIDGGYLYASKNKWQNGVEAAAMAGALGMCSDDFEAVTRQIARENGLPFDEESLVVAAGFYDVADDYGDFTAYRDFAVDPDPDTSLNDAISVEDDPVYNNAVMVSLNADVSTFLSGIFGKNKVNVSAKAVAYLERFLMISGGGDTPGITTATGTSPWKPGQYPSFHNGIIYSNNDIVFDTREDCEGPDFVNSHAYAHGRIYALDENGQTPSDEFGESEIKKIENPPVDWDELRDRAEANGKIINMAFFHGLSTSCMDWGRTIKGYWGTDEFDNCYFYGIEDSSTYFVPYPCDHKGRTYFFQDDLELIYVRGSICPMSAACCDDWPGGYPDYDRSVTGMTIAAVNGSICLSGAPKITWGGDNAEDLVSFYSGRDIIMGDVPDFGFPASDQGNDFAGAFLRAERNFGFFQSAGQPKVYPIRKMRVIAGDRIILHTVPTWKFALGQTEYGFDANFGPPCPAVPAFVKFGKLEPPTGG